MALEVGSRDVAAPRTGGGLVGGAGGGVGVGVRRLVSSAPSDDPDAGLVVFQALAWAFLAGALGLGIALRKVLYEARLTPD